MTAEICKFPAQQDHIRDQERGTSTSYVAGIPPQKYRLELQTHRVLRTVVSYEYRSNALNTALDLVLRAVDRWQPL